MFHKHSSFPDPTGYSRTEQVFPFTERQIPGNCLPTNPLAGSEDPEGAEIEVLERDVVP